jgi:predicted peroxiredoxin
VAKLLVHVTCGPEHPTKAALAFLVARAAIDDGHEVTMFLAGDGVQLVRDGVLDSLTGLGTGSLRESFDAVVAGGAKLYVSGMSSKARGVGQPDLEGKPAEMAMPSRLVQLAFEADRVITY